jgi:hypothetical protein
MRGKIILPNFIAVLLLGIGTFLFLRSDLRGKAEVALQQRMKTVSSLFVRSETLHGFELLNSVRKEALSKKMVQAFAPVELPMNEGDGSDSKEAVDAKVRQAWFAKCSTAIKDYTREWQKERHERPDLVLLTDRTGVVIARNVTPNACPSGYKLTGSMSIVDRALDGEASYAVWSVDDSPFNSKKPNKAFCQLMNTGLLEMAAAPVWYGDDIAGSLVIGFEISNGTAKKRATEMGLDVAVLTKGEVYSSSLDTDAARQSLEKALKSPDVVKIVSDSVERRIKSDIFEISVEGTRYYAMSLPNIHADPNDKVTTIIMGSQDAAFADLKSLNIVLVFMGIALLVIFVVGILLANHFMQPIVAIEEGILKVINGEYNYRFDVKSSEVGGLSYRINQMIGALMGEEEETEDE